MSLKNEQFAGAVVKKKDGSVVTYGSDGKEIKKKKVT